MPGLGGAGQPRDVVVLDTPPKSDLELRPALLVLLLAPELFAPLRAVGAQYHAAEEGRVAAGAALGILDEASAEAVSTRTSVLAPAPVSTPTPVLAGSLVVSGLGVHYPGRTAPALSRSARTAWPI